jgi:hypothetical protein
MHELRQPDRTTIIEGPRAVCKEHWEFGGRKEAVWLGRLRTALMMEAVDSVVVEDGMGGTPT